MRKKKISIAITAPLLKWLDLLARKTGESRSALISRILMNAKENE